MILIVLDNKHGDKKKIQLLFSHSVLEYITTDTLIIY